MKTRFRGPKSHIIMRDGGVELHVREFRITNLSTRQTEDGDEFIAGGYALTWAERAKIGYYYEQFVKGAFSGEGILDDVRLLVGHNQREIPLARSPMTMELREDNVGLWFEFRLDLRSPAHLVLAIALERGDIDKVSIGFTMFQEGAKVTTTTIEDGEELDTIEAVGDLREVSVVNWPAYDSSSVAPRAEEPEEADEREEVDNPPIDNELDSVRLDVITQAAEVRLRLFDDIDKGA